MTTKKTDKAAEAVSDTVDMVADKKQDAAVQSDAATELAKDALKQEAAMDTGTKSDAEPVGTKYLGSDEIQMYAYLIEGSQAALEKALDTGIPEEKVAGLLILERNGQNRTEFVKLLKKHLGIKDIKAELPQAGGPDYTNDTTNLRDL